MVTKNQDYSLGDTIFIETTAIQNGTHDVLRDMDTYQLPDGTSLVILTVIAIHPNGLVTAITKGTSRLTVTRTKDSFGAFNRIAFDRAYSPKS